jgi:uncharacterized protein (TIGR02145 family)
MKHIIYLLALATAILVACNPSDEEHADAQGVLINGVVWATTNVDAPGKFAAKPEDSGMFYQWGKNVGWSATDPLVSSNGDTTWDESVASGNVWASFYDPCPDGWRVPSFRDFNALTDGNAVVSTWTTRGGVNGKLFVDVATEKSIFLPAAGYRFAYTSAHYHVDIGGYYWSDTPIGAYSGYRLSFAGGTLYPSGNNGRGNGLTVRCVRK